MMRLSLLTQAALLIAVCISATAQEEPLNRLYSMILPSKQPTGNASASLTLNLNPAQKNEKFVLEEIWERHQNWDKLAKNMRGSVQFGRGASLWLLFGGGALQTFSRTLPDRRLFGIVGSAAVGASHVINNNFASKERVQDWTNALAISEKIKGQVFRFQAAVPPYETKDFNRIRRLVKEVTEMSKTSKNLTLKYASTDLRKKDRTPLPPKLDRNGYLEHRYQKQVDQFFLKAKSVSKKVERLKTFQAVLIGTSTAIGFLSNVSGLGKTYAQILEFAGAWPSTLTSGGIAIASHYKAGKYEEEAEEWSHAATQLKNLRLTLPNTAEPGVGGVEENEWRAFVERCEQVIYDSMVDFKTLKNKQTEPDLVDKAAKEL